MVNMINKNVVRGRHDVLRKLLNTGQFSEECIVKDVLALLHTDFNF